MEQRLARLYMGSVQLMSRGKRQTSMRSLDKLERISESQNAEVADRRLLLDTFRWLYLQLHAQQRSRIDVMGGGMKDSPQHVLANA